MLDNGFYEFNTTFSTDKFKGVKDKGLKKALKLAKEDAVAIAKAMNKKLGDILEINTTTRETPYIDARRSSTTIKVRKDMTEIKQSVQVHTYMEVKFSIIDE